MTTPMSKPLSNRKRMRVAHMLNAYLAFHARKWPDALRNRVAWMHLFEWARMGGKKNEVIQ